MIYASHGRRPVIDPTAWVAPDATVCGDVSIGPGSRVLHGARLVGEGGGRIAVGRDCIVMENAVVRGGRKHGCTIGDHCLVGPNAHVVGALVEDEVFLATGASVFHGAVIGRGSEVRVNGTVHLRTRLPPGSTVPIGWIAVGDPVHVLPPHRHDEIWAVQEPLDFPEWVYGVERGAPGFMVEMTRRLSASLATHAEDGA